MTILKWIDKENAILQPKKTSCRSLKAIPELSYDPHNNSKNLIIQGDNLEGLKSLLPFYAGQVKCVFIDPPYNTKKAFEQYDDNLEHSIWLSLMYPRLELLRELLSEDGSIWVSLDDNEGHYLKVIMDEIFGRKQFIANIIWQKKHTRSNDAKFFSDNHDHILCYAKNKDKWSRNLLERTDESNKSYKNPDNDPRGVWQSFPLHAKSGSKNNKNFSFTFKNGITWSPPAGTFPRFSKETLEKLEDDNRIWFGKNGTNVPRQKKFLSEIQSGLVPVTIWTHSEVGHNQDAKDEIKKFNNIDVFDTPKPERLIQHILQIATQKGDLILDSFLGSGTTAAVAHKMNRRYIGIEIGEHAKTHVVPRLKKVIEGEQGGISVTKPNYELEDETLKEFDLDIESIKQFHNVLNVIGKETNLIDPNTLKTLKQVTKIKKVGSKSIWQGGGSFCFCELGEPIFDEFGSINPTITFEELAAHIWYLENRTPLQNNDEKSSFIGVYEGRAFYLLYNGILGDKCENMGNALTKELLSELPHFDEFSAQGLPIVVYGETCLLSEAMLNLHKITFKQIPYRV